MTTVREAFGYTKLRQHGYTNYALTFLGYYLARNRMKSSLTRLDNNENTRLTLMHSSKFQLSY